MTLRKELLDPQDTILRNAGASFYITVGGSRRRDSKLFISHLSEYSVLLPGLPLSSLAPVTVHLRTARVLFPKIQS